METSFKEEGEKQVKKARLWLYISVAFFIMAMLTAFAVVPKNKKISTGQTKGVVISLAATSTIPDLTPEIDLKTETRLLDGEKVVLGSTSPPIIGVMIDNHVDARPQSGLDKARLVFEAEAEGGITRYLAFFTADEDLKEIGPIRSARPYFVDWAEELNALYAHVGGSPDALAKIIKDRVLDANEFYNAPYYWRDHSRLAPHNVYTSSELLDKYITAKKIETKEIDPWLFKDDETKEKLGDSKEIEIDYRLAGFKVNWKYNKENNNFVRFLDEKPHQSKTGEVITAKNLVIMTASANETDEKLRLDMKIIGSGKATICLDSVCLAGSWKKASSKERTRFFVDAEEVEFNRGVIWVEVIRPGYVVSIK